MKTLKKAKERGEAFEDKVASWAKRYFNAEGVEKRILMRGLRVKRPYEIDVHVYWRSGLFRRKEYDLWIECKNIKGSIKRKHVFELIEKAKDIEDAYNEGIEEFYFDFLAIASTSEFDSDALSYATDHDIACILYDGKRFRVLNEVKWI